jgi:hypothetical protein
LGVREGSGNIDDVIDVQLVLFPEFVGAVLDTPPDVLKLSGLEDIHSLRKTGEVLGIRLLSSLAEVMLVVGNQLIELVSSDKPVVTERLGTA